MNRTDVGHRFFGRAHVRLGDDLEKRRAGAVQVDATHAMKVFMQRFAGVLFQMRMMNAHALAHVVIQYDFHFALADDGLGHLAGLVALGQVGVEVVLALEQRGLGDLGIDRQAELDGHRHGAFIQYRQHARQAQIDGAGLGVGLGAKGGRGAGEDLGLGGELDVDFQPDDGFPLH